MGTFFYYIISHTLIITFFAGSQTSAVLLLAILDLTARISQPNLAFARWRGLSVLMRVYGNTFFPHSGQ